MTKIVNAAGATGWNMSLHPGGPKWTIQCGNCSVAWRARVPLVDYPVLGCPTCHTPNRINVVWTSNE